MNVSKRKLTGNHGLSHGMKRFPAHVPFKQSIGWCAGNLQKVGMWKSFAQTTWCSKWNQRIPWIPLCTTNRWVVRLVTRRVEARSRKITVRCSLGSSWINPFGHVYLLDGFSACFLVGGEWLPWNLFSHSYWVANHPNWRTHIFQRGGPTTNQFLIWIYDTCLKPLVVRRNCLMAISQHTHTHTAESNFVLSNGTLEYWSHRCLEDA